MLNGRKGVDQEIWVAYAAKESTYPNLVFMNITWTHPKINFVNARRWTAFNKDMGVTLNNNGSRCYFILFTCGSRNTLFISVISNFVKNKERRVFFVTICDKNCFVFSFTSLNAINIFCL